MRWAVGNMSSVCVNYTRQWKVSLSHMNTVISMEKILPNFEHRLLTIATWFERGSRLTSFSFILVWKPCGSYRVGPDAGSAMTVRGVLLAISKNPKGMCDPEQMFTCTLITDYKLVLFSVIFLTLTQKNSLAFLTYSSTDCNPRVDSYNHLRNEDAEKFPHLKNPSGCQPTVTLSPPQPPQLLIRSSSLGFVFWACHVNGNKHCVTFWDYE